MKKLIRKPLFIFVISLSFAVNAQTAVTKSSVFTEKTLRMPDPITVKYETGAPDVYSNPTNQTQITFENKNRDQVNLFLFNYENKEVQVMYARSRTGTEELFTIYTSQLPAGTYNCKIEAGTTVVSRKLIVAR